ncbi:MAG: ABC transporter permease [Lachnospiraceae bacterium]|nr:ABC transporter permease [Lachnospiraceae bacterium]
MFRYLFIAKNNIKKQKKDMITFLLMTLIASFLIFISLSFLLGTGSVLDTVYDQINGADLVMLMTEDKVGEAKLEEMLSGNEYVKGFEKHKLLPLSASKFRHKGDKAWTDYSMYFESYEQERTIQKISIDTAKMQGNEAVLPARMSMEFEKGDILEIKIGDNTYELKVAGFAEDTFFCSPLNAGAYLIYVSDKMYQQIFFDNPVADLEIQRYNIKYSDMVFKNHLEDAGIDEDIYNEYMDWYLRYSAEHPEFKGVLSNALPYAMLRVSAMLLPMIFVAIILLFALIIFAVALVLTHFSIKNFIMTNMRNTAIMEASGYTVKEMVIILLIQLLTVVFAGGLLGTALGMFSLDKLGFAILATLGLNWNQPADIMVAITVLVFMCLTVILMTLVIGRDYHKTTVLDALRGGINTHNFKKNLFPFEKTALPVPFVIALKETFGKFRSQLGIVFIAFVLTVASIIGFGMRDSFTDELYLMGMAGYVAADADLYVDEATEQYIRSMGMVEYMCGECWESVSYTSGKVRKEQVISCKGVTTDTPSGLMLVEGRMPVHDNEMIFATSAAERMKVSVGDVVTAKVGLNEENYIVTGIVQTLNNMGMMSYMSIGGLERMTGHLDGHNWLVKLKDGYTLDDFKEAFGKIYPDIEVYDFMAEVYASIGMVMTGVSVVALLIGVLTVIIVAFVEALVVRTQITKSWRDLGVSKALGYTSGQLIIQVMLSNIPALLTGTALGLLSGGFFSRKIVALLLSICGFKKMDFTILPGSYILATVIIIGVAMLTAAFAGRRIKKLEPVKMITEE